MSADIEAIKSRYDFLSLLQSDTALRKAGLYHIGPCPFCGGKDRFQTKEIEPSVFVWICRQCGSGKYNDVLDYVMRREHLDFKGALRVIGASDEELSGLPTREQMKVRKAEAVQREAVRQETVDRKLETLTTQEIWEGLHRRMEDEHRAWWRGQGIPDAWQDYLKLGFTPDKAYYNKKEELVHSPAYTIPYFLHDKKAPEFRRFRTMQYRLCDTPDPNDRYRFESGCGTSFFMTTPTLPIKEQVVICEGAKKAIVTHIRGGDKEISVLGVPSKVDCGKVTEVLGHCKRVWVALDPDAVDRAYSLARKIGNKARVVELPMKIDDAFLQGFLTPNRWARMLTQGVKVA